MSTGLVSNVISQFCVTVVIATLFSLLSSFTIVPWLSSRFGKLEHITGKNIFEKFILWFEKQLTKFTHFISDMLEWCLKSTLRRIGVFFGIFVVLIGTVVVLMGGGYIGGEFFPKTDKGEFLVQMELPKDATIEESNFVTQKAEKFLRGKKEVVDMITTVGQSSEGFGAAQATAYKAEIDVILNDKSERTDNSFTSQFKNNNKKIPSVKKH